MCENVHSCIYRGFLHLTGLAGSHLPFIRRILQTRTPWKGLVVVIVVVPEFVTAERMRNAVHRPTMRNSCPCQGMDVVVSLPVITCTTSSVNEKPEVLTVQQPGQCRAALKAAQ